MSSLSLNRVEIDLAALKANYRILQSRVQDDVVVMGMVKSDAYGHGLERAASALSEAGATVFGVAETEEGVRLRQAGLAGEIIVLSGACQQGFSDIIDYGLTPVVYDLHMLANLSGLAMQQDSCVNVHLKVDIGMGRFGILPSEVRGFVAGMQGMKGVSLAGIFGHFPLADRDDAAVTVAQLNMFNDVLKEVDLWEKAGTIVHSANSAALLKNSDSHFDMVRPGITLYGCRPGKGEVFEHLQLQPVMQFKTNIMQIKDVPQGAGISYGHLHTTVRPTKLAVLPVGYDDGYLRRLAGKAQVLIRGRRAPVLGMICMNACMADVTDIDGVKAGDEVVLMGRQGDAEITVDEIAAWSDTINYEILCLFGGRNRKVYID